MTAWGGIWLRWLPLVCVLGCACERRVHEPPTQATAQPPAPTPVVPAVSSSPGRSREPKQASEAQRCMVPSPSKPIRPAPPPGADPQCPPDPTGRLALERATVHITGQKSKKPVTVSVEVADQEEQRMRGLMFRRQLAEEQGMLFIFQQRRPLRFWMKNTCLPLDMLFVDSDGFVVAIEENVPTMNERTYGPPCPALMVLEVNAGWARRNGVKAGDRMRIERGTKK